MSYELRLKRLRMEKGLTQQQMADAIGVSFPTYRNWEQGVSRFTLEHACMCSDVLGCTPNDLCGWYETHPRQDVAPAPVQRRYDAASDAVKRAVDAVLDSEKRGCSRAAHAAGDLSAALSA